MAKSSPPKKGSKMSKMNHGGVAMASRPMMNMVRPDMTGRAYKKGGSVTRADGAISKGHTKGKMV